MSSLWTPYGEQPVEPDRPDTPTAPGRPGPTPAGSADLGTAGDSGDLGTGEEEIDPDKMREMLARLAATPVEAIVTQFVVQLQELAVLHLGIAGERAESLPQAALAIDAFAALVEGLGARLDPNADALRQVLAQLRLAYVEVSGVQPDPAGTG